MSIGEGTIDAMGERHNRRWLNFACRFVQLISAIVVIGIYAADNSTAQKEIGWVESKWIYAVVIGTFSALTAVGYTIVACLHQYRTVAKAFLWDWLLTIFWAGVSGVFCSMYLSTDNMRMKAAAGFDVANLLFWGISAITATVVYFRKSRAEPLFVKEEA